MPGILSAQQTTRSHTVVGGDTLWDLANAYFGNPFDWRRIWEVNRDRVADPNLILPGQVLVIPGAGEAPAVTDVTVEAPPPRSEPAVARPPAEPPGARRTIFFRDTTDASGVVGTERADYLVVPPDLVYQAPWLIGLQAEPAHAAVLLGFARPERSATPRSHDDVRLRVDGPPPAVGDVLRTYRVSRTIEGVGKVVEPTGLVRVRSIAGGEALGVMVKEYGRISPGDLVGPLPAYTLEPGRYPEPVTGGPQAMVMGFAAAEVIPNIGSVAFLDLGSDEGVSLGDEFEYTNPVAGTGVVEGRLQVVGVAPRTASARIVSLKGDVMDRGVVVRLARKMP